MKRDIYVVRPEGSQPRPSRSPSGRFYQAAMGSLTTTQESIFPSIATDDCINMLPQHAFSIARESQSTIRGCNYSSTDYARVPNSRLLSKKRQPHPHLRNKAIRRRTEGGPLHIVAGRQNAHALADVGTSGLACCNPTRPACVPTSPPQGKIHLQVETCLAEYLVVRGGPIINESRRTDSRSATYH